MLETVFDGINGNVGLNDYWQNHQEWPTLAHAKKSNQRVFAIVRTKTKVSSLPSSLSIKVKVIQNLQIF